MTTLVQHQNHFDATVIWPEQIEFCLFERSVVNLRRASWSCAQCQSQGTASQCPHARECRLVAEALNRPGAQ